MSPGKFASITDSLLARKGEARPWEDPNRKPLPWREDISHPLPGFTPIVSAAAPTPTAAPFAEVRPSAVRPAPLQSHDVEFSDMSATVPAHHGDESPHPSDEHEKMKKCTVRMSFHDYERLGIIAVKKNVTRQHLLQEALEQFFDAATEAYQKDCACLNAETCCQD